MATTEQIGTYAKTLPISAKPLFIGSIPIAASSLINNLKTVRTVVRNRL